MTTTPDVPFFDFVRGQSAFVTTISGGKPALDAERRRITTAGIGLTPIKQANWRLGLDYVDTDIRNLARKIALQRWVATRAHDE